MLYTYNKNTEVIEWGDIIDKDSVVLYSRNNCPMKNYVSRIYNAMIKQPEKDGKLIRTIDVLENL